MLSNLQYARCVMRVQRPSSEPNAPGMSHAIGGCKGSLASRGVQHHWCSLPPHVSNIWKHLNLNSIFPIWERAIHARGMLAIASRKTIAIVPSRIVWVYQGALEARLGLTHVSHRCRTKDCDISIDIETHRDTVRSRIIEPHNLEHARGSHSHANPQYCGTATAVPVSHTACGCCCGRQLGVR